MTLKDASPDKLKHLSMIDLANLLLMDQRKALDFKEMFNEISKIKGFSKAEELDKLAQFYTDLNTDGRFMTLGSNVWGLKRWYPVDEIDEEIKVRPKKKKKRRKEDDDDLLDDDIELDDDDLELLDDEEEDDETYSDVLEDEDDDEFTNIDDKLDEDLDDDLLDDEEFADEEFDEEEEDFK
ncbi:MAG TPA: DNA-directed RNA polymerase subunit delta [Cerasibacillus sp.]|uniref:DNA-directed RNA polymerase subunit delta n=1 Tax=Cerasibacillus sp. TaxID=2498711 RepID=UPI002F3EA135